MTAVGRLAVEVDTVRGRLAGGRPLLWFGGDSDDLVEILLDRRVNVMLVGRGCPGGLDWQGSAVTTQRCVPRWWLPGRVAALPKS